MLQNSTTWRIDADHNVRIGGVYVTRLTNAFPDYHEIYVYFDEYELDKPVGDDEWSIYASNVAGSITNFEGETGNDGTEDYVRFEVIDRGVSLTTKYDDVQIAAYDNDDDKNTTLSKPMRITYRNLVDP